MVKRLWDQEMGNYSEDHAAVNLPGGTSDGEFAARNSRGELVLNTEYCGVISARELIGSLYASIGKAQMIICSKVLM